MTDNNTKDVPEWAKRRACELAGKPWEPRDIDVQQPSFAGHSAMLAFARYIAKHEEPPVDPLLIEAREIVKATLSPDRHSRCNCREKIAAGEWDEGQKVQASLAALRRGIELGASNND
jgi:hypothetical protein